MKAQIVSIGNELLIGDTVNTNASWIGRFLTEQGFRVDQVRTLSDDEEQIASVLTQALSEADLVVTTGGLGPTHDDVTKKVIARLLEVELVFDETVMASIEERFRRRGIALRPSHREQAMVPQGSRVLANAKGTAPGIWVETDGVALAVLPGVPYEMRYLMENGVAEQIVRRFKGRQVYATRYLKTAGVTESTLSEEVIGPLEEFLREGNGVAYLPSPQGVTIRISRSGKDRTEADGRLEPLLAHIRRKAGGLIFGEGRDLELADVLGGVLRHKGLLMAVAESCSGGLISDRLTDIPGSSDYFLGGIVAYDDRVKRELLGVESRTLEDHGAVSAQTALEMVRGVVRMTGAQVAVSATGIAGPDGGTPDKPVGTVWMGFRIADETFALRTCFTDDRRLNKIRTATVALETVRRRLLGVEPLPYDLKPVRP